MYRPTPLFLVTLAVLALLATFLAGVLFAAGQL